MLILKCSKSCNIQHEIQQFMQDMLTPITACCIQILLCTKAQGQHIQNKMSANFSVCWLNDCDMAFRKIKVHYKQ
jgi:hypothetical protein